MPACRPDRDPPPRLFRVLVNDTILEFGTQIYEGLAFKFAIPKCKCKLAIPQNTAAELITANLDTVAVWSAIQLLGRRDHPLWCRGRQDGCGHGTDGSQNESFQEHCRVCSADDTG